jgi:hypothetical protein
MMMVDTPSKVACSFVLITLVMFSDHVLCHMPLLPARLPLLLHASTAHNSMLCSCRSGPGRTASFCARASCICCICEHHCNAVAWVYGISSQTPQQLQVPHSIKPTCSAFSSRCRARSLSTYGSCMSCCLPLARSAESTWQHPQHEAAALLRQAQQSCYACNVQQQEYSSDKTVYTTAAAAGAAVSKQCIHNILWRTPAGCCAVAR